MNANRTERLEGVFRQYAAEYLARNAGPGSLITVTRVSVSANEKFATIYITVLPVEKEEAALGFARRNVHDLKSYLREHIKMHHIPHVDFIIDDGEKNRQRIDELSVESEKLTKPDKPSDM